MGYPIDGEKSRQCGCKTIKIGTVIFVEFGNGFFRSCIERNENDTLQKARNKQIDECNIMQQGNKPSKLLVYVTVALLLVGVSHQPAAAFPFSAHCRITTI